MKLVFVIYFESVLWRQMLNSEPQNVMKKGFSVKQRKKLYTSNKRQFEQLHELLTYFNQFKKYLLKLFSQKTTDKVAKVTKGKTLLLKFPCLNCKKNESCGVEEICCAYTK